VDAIVKIYEPYADLQLADMVCNHQMWIEAYKEGYKTKISQNAIAREFHDMLLHTKLEYAVFARAHQDTMGALLSHSSYGVINACACHSSTGAR